MTTMNKKQRRKNHADFCEQRNREQGHTGGPNSRGKQRPAGIERPSFHTPSFKRKQLIVGEIDTTTAEGRKQWSKEFREACEHVFKYESFDSSPATMAEYDELCAEAKRRKKSFKKIASAAGWELVDPNPKAVKLPESWQRRV